MSLSEDVLDRVDRVLGAITTDMHQQSERKWRGICAICGERTMELKVDLDDHRLWLDCWHATCTEAEILEALELTVEDLRPPRAKEPARLARHKLSDVKLEAIEFLVAGLVPYQAVSLLGGDPGLGKSMWTCLIAACASSGLYGEPLAVGILNAEDTRSVVRGRVQAAGGDLELVEVLTKENGGFEQVLTLPDDVTMIEEFVVDTGARLLVIDPLMAFITERADTNQDHAIRRALANLSMMAERRRVAVLVAAHLNKDEQKAMLYRVGGSIGLVGAARSLLLFAADPDDEDGPRGKRRLLAHAKANWSERAGTLRYRQEEVVLEEDGEPVTTMVLRPNGTSDLEAEDLVGRRRAEGKLTEASAALLAAVADGPRPCRNVKPEVQEEADCSVGTVQRAAEVLRKRGELETVRVGNQTYWKLPGDGGEEDVEAGAEDAESAAKPASQVGVNVANAKPQKPPAARARARKDDAASHSQGGDRLAKPDEKPVEPVDNGAADRAEAVARILRGEG